MSRKSDREAEPEEGMIWVQHQEEDVHWFGHAEHGAPVTLTQALLAADVVQATPNGLPRVVMTKARPSFNKVRSMLTSIAAAGGIADGGTIIRKGYTHGAKSMARFMRVDVENRGWNLR